MSKIFRSALLIATIVCLTQSISMFNLNMMNKSSGAMCMDGSQYGIYTFVPDTDTPVNKLLIYFEEIWEGWCVKDNLNDSITRCHQYTNDSNLV